MKLSATRISLIGEGMKFPINNVINETTFIGNRQYPNMQALWKNDLSYIYLYISDPRKLALRYTTRDPTHIVKNIDVIIVEASF